MLKIGIAEYEQVQRHGEETYPDECCGILVGLFLGDTRFVASVVPCANSALEPLSNRYSIDPAEVIRARRDARHRSLEIVGFYHSHPDHAPEWSSIDLQDAHWVGCSYLITSVKKGVASETKSFVLKGSLEEDKIFVQEDVAVTS